MIAEPRWRHPWGAHFRLVHGTKVCSQSCTGTKTDHSLKSGWYVAQKGLQPLLIISLCRVKLVTKWTVQKYIILRSEEEGEQISKNGKICWSSKALVREGPHRLPVCKCWETLQDQQVYASLRLMILYSMFRALCMSKVVESIIMDMANLEGWCRYSKDQQKFTSSKFHAYFGLLILPGFYKLQCQPMESKNGKGDFATCQRS